MSRDRVRDSPVRKWSRADALAQRSEHGRAEQCEIRTIAGIRAQAVLLGDERSAGIVVEC